MHLPCLSLNTVCDSHLHYVGQQSLEDLVLPVAQEAVCVQRVLLAIQTQLHHVVFVLYFLLSRECYLGGCSAKIKRSHGGSAGAEPAPHEAVLNKNIKNNFMFFYLHISTRSLIQVFDIQSFQSYTIIKT